MATMCKKYRVDIYDEYDKMYAIVLKRYTCPQAFHDFTENLMNETYINRFKLLDAIDDYKIAGLHKKFPLLIEFQEKAFNYRPYQHCCIS